MIELSIAHFKQSFIRTADDIRNVHTPDIAVLF